MMRLIISMVVYRTPIEAIKPLLDEALHGLGAIPYEVHILDNADDGKLQSRCKQNLYGYHCLGRNVGFGKGHNEIFKKTTQKNTTYLFLNPFNFWLTVKSPSQMKREPCVALMG